MKTYFGEDPVYKERFSQIWLWSEWASMQPGFDGAGSDPPPEPSARSWSEPQMVPDGGSV